MAGAFGGIAWAEATGVDVGGGGVVGETAASGGFGTAVIGLGVALVDASSGRWRAGTTGVGACLAWRGTWGVTGTGSALSQVTISTCGSAGNGGGGTTEVNRENRITAWTIITATNKALRVWRESSGIKVTQDHHLGHSEMVMDTDSVCHRQAGLTGPRLKQCSLNMPSKARSSRLR